MRLGDKQYFLFAAGTFPFRAAQEGAAEVSHDGGCPRGSFQAYGWDKLHFEVSHGGCFGEYDIRD